MEYEPFGQLIDKPGIELSRLGGGQLEAGLRRAGVGVFWLLAVGIVAARAVYFNPDLAEAFENVVRAAPRLFHSIFAA